MTPAERWVDEVARTTKPANVVWCDGSEAENERLVEGMLEDGTLIALNKQAAPDCTLHRSHPSDVARTEHLTFIASRRQEDAGPTNNWMAPQDAKARVGPLFDGVMKGRTMYVVPYVMGPLRSPFSKVGIEVTDSPYVVANMRIMTRMGQAALDQLGGGDEFVPGLHSTGDLSPDRRYIVHFPEERLIWSVGSGYGGNALLGQEVLRAAHRQHHGARPGLDGRAHADPGADAALGRDALRGRGLPLGLRQDQPGHAGVAARARRCSVRTIGDDIAWLRPGPDGRLWAVNPEAGFFGVVPGTGPDTNPMALETIAQNTIFTNVAVTPDGVPWWEGKDKKPARGPDRLAGQALGPHGQGRSPELALHRARPPVPDHVVAMGGPAGRAAVRDHLRRPARARGAAGLPEPRLGARRVRGRDHGLGDDRRGHRPGGRGAPRSHGHAAVLRLQHGRLLRALAAHGPGAVAAARHLPRQLVPHRQGRPVRLAGLRRRTCASCCG